MKLYMTMEDEFGSKVEKTFLVDEDSAGLQSRWGTVVENMFDEIMQIRPDEEVLNEAKRLTVHND